MRFGKNDLTASHIAWTGYITSGKDEGLPILIIDDNLNHYPWIELK